MRIRTPRRWRHLHQHHRPCVLRAAKILTVSQTQMVLMEMLSTLTSAPTPSMLARITQTAAHPLLLMEKPGYTKTQNLDWESPIRLKEVAQATRAKLITVKAEPKLITFYLSFSSQLLSTK